MNFELKTFDIAGAANEKCDALIVLLSQSFKPGKDVLSTLVAQALKAGDLETKPGKSLVVYRPAGMACSRAVLASIGDGSAKEVRQAVSAAVAAVKAVNVKKLAICFATLPQENAVRAAVMAVAEASYVFTTTKSKPEGRAIQRVVLGLQNSPKIKAVFDRSVAAVTGSEFAKEWANRPANYATPTLLANAARALAKLPNIKCEVFGPKEVAKLGMGSFMAVAQGSEEPLRFIVLRYDGAVKSEAPTVLVGKGITFDSGGISIKPAAEMDEMKFDMSGAASVLGVFRALAELKPAINVVGLIPSCENLINGRAVKPGDVSLDLCWRMPLDDDYAEGLKSNFADVANVGGRAGGAITAAKFLQRFTGAFPWAHLDIAGTAWKSGAAKGATGRPVALLLEYLLTSAKHK
jgi:leucyl aminopeptidase